MKHFNITSMRVSVRLVLFPFLSGLIAGCYYLGLPHASNRQAVPQVRIIAHRGAPTFAPENTLPAIRKALEIGVDMIEIDVHQTKDGVLVIMHDEKVNKTTDGSGYIKDMTFDDIRALDAGSWFDPVFTGTKVPALEEVFRIMDETTKLLIEIKKGSPYYPSIEERVLQSIAMHEFEERVEIKSFERRVVEYIREHAADIPIGKSFVFRIPLFRIIVDRGVRWGSVYEYEVDFLHSHWLTTTQALVRRARDEGFGLYAWDVNTEGRMRRLINMGVDAIETDYPHVLKEILEAKNRE
jgi:glycerophosphoryl diester phosphodiesterase